MRLTARPRHGRRGRYRGRRDVPHGQHDQGADPRGPLARVEHGELDCHEELTYGKDRLYPGPWPRASRHRRVRTI